jgi:isopentenyl-diphosphate delta-isomerase
MQSYLDIVDESDNLLGFKASYDEVHKKGLWCRAIHTVIYTPDRQIVMQKRSPSLKYRPGEVEISVGGGVDAGESPEEAAIREIREELGIVIGSKDLHFIGKTKQNFKTKTQIVRDFVYSYSICLPKDTLEFNASEEETTAIFLISEKKLRRALMLHKLRYAGKTTPTYSYWQYLLDSIT